MSFLGPNKTGSKTRAKKKKRNKMKPNPTLWEFEERKTFIVRASFKSTRIEQSKY
jgi:hypothetical protein